MYFRKFQKQALLWHEEDLEAIKVDGNNFPTPTKSRMILPSRRKRNAGERLIPTARQRKVVRKRRSLPEERGPRDSLEELLPKRRKVPARSPPPRRKAVRMRMPRRKGWLE